MVEVLKSVTSVVVIVILTSLWIPSSNKLSGIISVVL